MRLLSSKLQAKEELVRRKTAEVLHDSIGQFLYALKWEVDRIGNRGRVTPDFLHEANELIENAIGVTRTLTEDLYPRELYQFGLIQAIKILATRFKKRYGLSIDHEFEGHIPEFPEDISILIYSSIRTQIKTCLINR